jgi:hypothetical protein
MPIVIGSGESILSWDQARTKVRGDLWRPGTAGVPDDVVDRALHASILDIEAERRWLWLENIDATLTVATAADNVALEIAVRSIARLSHISGTNLNPVRRAQLEAVRELAAGSTGEPLHYALTDGRLYFDATVPANTTFEMIFSSRCPELLDDAIQQPSATLWRQQQAVIAKACSYVALSYLKNDAEAERQEAAYQRHLNRAFNIEDEQRVEEGGGSIVPDLTYHHAAYGYRGG